ncbi:MAG TPA: phosphoribosyltransferase family protein [Ferruginibacter sp.]|nr:phosphoribosyltransferase family protein [Ferruginibacter sp.]
MPLIKRIFADAAHLFYPHICTGCGSDLIGSNNLLCSRCIADLPHTNFEKYADNMVERIFRGRLPLRAAHAEFYFSKGQLIQHLIHEIKYNNNKEMGIYLGEFVGKNLLQCSRFTNLDYIIPLPLYQEKEFRRGYNQAEIICNGLAVSMNVPVMIKNITRKRNTETQTRKHRAQRWENVSGSFNVSDPACLAGKNLLLVDDVITTGATLEACAREMLKIPGVSISIAALAIATK